MCIWTRGFRSRCSSRGKVGARRRYHWLGNEINMDHYAKREASHNFCVKFTKSFWVKIIKYIVVNSTVGVYLKKKKINWKLKVNLWLMKKGAVMTEPWLMQNVRNIFSVLYPQLYTSQMKWSEISKCFLLLSSYAARNMTFLVLKYFSWHFRKICRFYNL